MYRFAFYLTATALAASALASTSALAEESTLTNPPTGMVDFGINDDINPLIPHLGAIKPTAITELPVSGFAGVEAEGEIFFVSSNGRYVIQGRAHDLWYDLPLNSMENIDISATTLRMADMGIDTRKLSSLTLGDPDAAVEQVHSVFIDPACEHCLAYVEQVSNLDDSDYTSVAFVMVPAFGGDSETLVEQFVCRDDSVTDDQALTALLHQTLDTLPQLDADDCDLTPYRSALLVAEQLQVNGVPFTATASGEVIRGIPDNITDALRGAQ